MNFICVLSVVIIKTDDDDDDDDEDITSRRNVLSSTPVSIQHRQRMTVTTRLHYITSHFFMIGHVKKCDLSSN